MPLVFLFALLSVCLSCSPYSQQLFFFRWVEIFVTPAVGSIWVDSLKPWVSGWPGQFKELQDFKLQRDRDWNLWQDFWVAVLLVVSLWLGRNLGYNLLMEFVVLFLYFIQARFRPFHHWVLESEEVCEVTCWMGTTNTPKTIRKSWNGLHAMCHPFDIKKTFSPKSY